MCSPTARLQTMPPMFPAPDHAEGLVEQLDPHEAGLLPLSGMGGGIGFQDLPGNGKHHHDGAVLRGW